LLAAPGEARADRIFVKAGSIIRGKAIVDEAHADQYLIFSERGKTPIILKRDRVASIVPEAGVLDEYAARRKAFFAGPPTAIREYELAVWCEEHKLADLATVHNESAIKREPEFGPAHKKLGHIEHDGKWYTPAEYKKAQGYVLVKGKWLSPEEKSRYDAETAKTAESQSWLRRLTSIRSNLLSRSEAQIRGAEEQLNDIKEPAAVPAVVRVLAADQDPTLRKLGARVLSSIHGKEAAAALVDRLLAETEPDVRQAVMLELNRSKEANIVPRLVQALGSKSLEVVNRAAWGLGNLNATSSVPKLVPALTMTDMQLVWVPSTNGGGQGMGIAMNGGGGAGFGVHNKSIPILTGPAVGAGVVAYGMTSVPSSAFGGGVSVGLNGGVAGGGAEAAPEPKYVQVTNNNTEVLAALVKLTGQDFGYDIPAWRRWLATSYKPDTGPSKRVPQP
jgi:hypothetical protein